MWQMSHTCTRFRDIAAIWCRLQYVIGTLGSRRTWQYLLVPLVYSSSCDLHVPLFVLFPPYWMHPSPSRRATARMQFVYYLRLSASRHSERPSSAPSVHDAYSWHLLQNPACPAQRRLTVQSRLPSLSRRRRTPARKIKCAIWPCCGRLHGVWFTGHRFSPADVRLRQRRQAMPLSSTGCECRGRRWQRR